MTTITMQAFLPKHHSPGAGSPKSQALPFLVSVDEGYSDCPLLGAAIKQLSG
ncbi:MULTISPECIES: hypothetical protein [unclassified Novosphingobium]|uniref:hypothetical protein n=1 Tax=unclassified Novosphingobium TaxID=2644732 RepID=UPI001359A42A|nr:MULTISPECIES: hypothetical protein [unclassified Novosphingobium]